jgi:hypothetical protein
MPYPIAIDPKTVRSLQRRVWAAVDAHLLWAFNPQRELLSARER